MRRATASAAEAGVRGMAVSGTLSERTPSGLPWPVSARTDQVVVGAPGPVVAVDHEAAPVEFGYFELLGRAYAMTDEAARRTSRW